MFACLDFLGTVRKLLLHGGHALFGPDLQTLLLSLSHISVKAASDHYPDPMGQYVVWPKRDQNWSELNWTVILFIYGVKTLFLG